MTLKALARSPALPVLGSPQERRTCSCRSRPGSAFVTGAGGEPQDGWGRKVRQSRDDRISHGPRASGVAPGQVGADRGGGTGEQACHNLDLGGQRVRDGRAVGRQIRVGVGVGSKGCCDQRDFGPAGCAGQELQAGEVVGCHAVAAQLTVEDRCYGIVADRFDVAPEAEPGQGRHGGEPEQCRRGDRRDDWQQRPGPECQSRPGHSEPAGGPEDGAAGSSDHV
jgi:hypothetical protein